MFFDPARDYNIHMLVGNHDAYYKNTNDVNSISLTCAEYKNITLYALMTGGLFYGLTKLNAHRPFQPVGPLHELELMSFDDYYEEEAEWYQ